MFHWWTDACCDTTELCIQHHAVMRDYNDSLAKVPYSQLKFPNVPEVLIVSVLWTESRD